LGGTIFPKKKTPQKEVSGVRSLNYNRARRHMFLKVRIVYGHGHLISIW
jgi:hypothetical protein